MEQEDPKLQSIRERVAQLKLSELQDEIKKLQEQKQALEKEKQLKLQLVKEKLALIPKAVQAQHPVLSTIASKLGSGAVKLGKYLVEQQRAEELHRAQLDRLQPKVQVKPQPEYVPYLDRVARATPQAGTTVIDRLVSTRQPKLPKAKGRKKVKEKPYTPLLYRIAEA